MERRGRNTSVVDKGNGYVSGVDMSESAETQVLIQQAGLGDATALGQLLNLDWQRPAFPSERSEQANSATPSAEAVQVTVQVQMTQ